MAVKDGKLGYNESTFMPISSTDALGFQYQYKQNKNWKISLCKMYHILPKVQSKQYIIYNRYIPKIGNNKFSGKSIFTQ